MDYQIAWTDPALDDFEAIVRYLARRSLVGAENVRLAILNHVDALANFPLIGAVYAGDPTGRTREVVCRKYRIFYRVDAEARRVEILTVWHSSREEPHLPP